MTEPWEDAARRELAPKLASSAFMIAIDPGEIDPKVALEVGYAILLDKPIVLLVPADREPTPGLARIATATIRLTAPLDSVTGQLELQAGLRNAEPWIRSRRDERPCGRTDIVTGVDGRELLFRCDRERDHRDRHHAVNVEGVELFWARGPRRSP